MQRQQYNQPGEYPGENSAPTFDRDHIRVAREARPGVGSRPPQRKNHLWTAVGSCIAVLVIVAVAAAFSKPFRHQIEISVARQETPYTQLYFATPTKLPAHLKVGASNAFSFTIENDEGHTYNYDYTVTLTDSKSHVVVSESAVTISDGDRETVRISIVPKDRNSMYLVTVALEGMNQSIHFYAEAS